MIYSRHDIVELVKQQPAELQSQLIALIWYASKGNPNEANPPRYGLLQLDQHQLRYHAMPHDPAELLNPELNIQLGAQLLQRIGLLEFAGRNLAPSLPAIIALSAWLDNQAS